MKTIFTNNPYPILPKRSVWTIKRCHVLFNIEWRTLTIFHNAYFDFEFKIAFLFIQIEYLRIKK
jgi:hypothetical protein